MRERFKKQFFLSCLWSFVLNIDIGIGLNIDIKIYLNIDIKSWNIDIKSLNIDIKTWRGKQLSTLK